MPYEKDRLIAASQKMSFMVMFGDYLKGVPKLVLALGFLIVSLGFLFVIHYETGLIFNQPLTISLLGKTKTVENIQSFVFDALILPTALLFLVMACELLFCDFSKSALYRLVFSRASSALADLSYYVLETLKVMGLIAKLMTFGIGAFLGQILGAFVFDYLGLSISLMTPYFALNLLVYFVIYTFLDYWAHRFYHTKVFWPLHRYHHAATEFTAITAIRMHPASFVGIFLISLPMGLMGASPEVSAGVGMMVAGIGYLIHSNIDTNWGFVGRYILQSPNDHRLHHKYDMSWPTGHFGILPLWDHMFGTFYGVKEGVACDQDLEIGVSRSYKHGLNIIPDLMRDYVEFGKALLCHLPIIGARFKHFKAELDQE